VEYPKVTFLIGLVICAQIADILNQKNKYKELIFINYFNFYLIKIDLLLIKQIILYLINGNY
jgi:hypothetical protein